MTLADGPKLIPGAATAALMVTLDRRYLMQLRDDIPAIFFPGYWGCFGGAIEGDETPEEGMRRELMEELCFTPQRLTHFATLGLDFGFVGLGAIPRHFFEVPIEEGEIAAMVLGEGQDLKLFDGDAILRAPGVIPYDATVIWQHLTRHRF